MLAHTTVRRRISVQLRMSNNLAVRTFIKTDPSALCVPMNTHFFLSVSQFLIVLSHNYDEVMKNAPNCSSSPGQEVGLPSSYKYLASLCRSSLSRCDVNFTGPPCTGSGAGSTQALQERRTYSKPCAQQVPDGTWWTLHKSMALFSFLPFFLPPAPVNPHTMGMYGCTPTMTFPTPKFSLKQ